MPKTWASCCSSSSGSWAVELRAMACSCIVANAPATVPSAIQPATLSLAPMTFPLPARDKDFTPDPVYNYKARFDACNCGEVHAFRAYFSRDLHRVAGLKLQGPGRGLSS